MMRVVDGNRTNGFDSLADDVRSGVNVNRAIKLTRVQATRRATLSFTSFILDKIITISCAVLANYCKLGPTS